jgi:LppX_LprAFG lipoprotein
MKSIKHYPLLFLGLALAMMVMSACGSTGSSTTSNLTPLQVIQNSANTMKNVKTVHDALNATIQASGVGLGTSGTQTPTNVGVTLKGSGDQSIPDKQQKMNLTLNLGSTTTQVSEIVTNNTAYIQLGQGQWYSIDENTLEQSGSNANVGSLFSGMTLDENSLLGIIENVKITDHGDQNLNGQSLRHITADMDKAAFEQLVAANPQLKSEFGSQDLTSTLNNVKNFNASIDVYIDESQFYVHRTELKVSFAAASNGTTANTSIDFIIDLSNFNNPVTITAPANATPITNPSQLLGGLTS